MRRETNQWLMAFSVSFGVTFLAMAVVLGGICFVSYTRTGKSPRRPGPTPTSPTGRTGW